VTRLVALVAEDEAPQRESLCAQLGELWPELDPIVPCEDGLAALEAIVEHRPAVAFLDIRMPGVGGLDVARAAIEHGALVVFTTAYDAHAVAAFDAGAIDYVLKPIRIERLAQSLVRVRERLASRARPDLDALFGELAARFKPAGDNAIRWITAAIGDEVRLIALDDVVYFQADDKYVRVATKAEDALIRLPLKELVAGLDPDAFWQIHRGTVVRVAAVDRMRRDELGRCWLSVKGRAERLPVSAAFQRRFRGM